MSVRLHGQEADAESLALFQMLKRVQHRVVFGGAGDDVFSPFCVFAGEADDGEIVRLRPAARENDLVRTCAE